MTQTVSPEKKRNGNIPLHFGIALAGNNKSTFAICAAMHLLGVPAVLISVMVHLHRVFADPKLSFIDYFSESDGYIVIACIALIIAFFCGTTAAMNSFKHLYDKQKVDMELSLPMSSKQRFLSGYFSGLAVYILPFIGAEIISCILFLIGHLVYDGRELPVDPYSYWGRPGSIDFFSHNFPLFAKAAVGGLLLMTMFYTMWVLTMTFCGSKLEATLYGAGANLVMPALYSAITVMIQNHMYGADMSVLSHDPLSAVLYATSPIGAAISLGLSLANEDGFTFPGYVLPTVICTVIFFIAAYFSYKRRRAEETGKSFAVKEFYYVVLTCMVFFVLISLNSLGADEMLIPSVIITCAAYVILDCLSARGMRRIGISFVKYIITAAASAGIYFLIIITGFFGAENRVPNVSEIQSAEITRYYSGIVVPHTSISGNFSYSGEEALTIITDMHRRQLELHKINGNEAGGHYIYTSVSYMLKNGFTMTRQYPAYTESYGKLLPLQACDETKQQLVKETEKLAENIEDMKNIRIVYDRDRGYDNAQIKYVNSKEFAAGFTAAYIEDIQNMTVEALARPKHSSYGTVTVQEMKSSDEYSRSEWAEIPACFEKTAEYLRSLGLETEEKHYYDTAYEEQTISVNRFIPKDNLPVRDGENIGLMTVLEQYDYSDPDYFEDTSLEEVAEGYGEIMLAENMDNTDLYMLYSIFSHGIGDYIPDSECYTVSCGGHTMSYVYVPEEYNSEIERILEKYINYGGAE